ncbi:MAG: precorrin-4 C(11)-methyltransferase [Eubacteriales bacterium]|jgi:precorrin-4/cobalt-precorrin-4 C11-methyltransferase
MVHFVGAGCGAPDLITIRGKKYVDSADCVIYAGSLVNPALLDDVKDGCLIYNSARMTLEQVIKVIRSCEEKGLTTVRLHTGDPCLYGAVREQMDALDSLGIRYDWTPGVSSFCGAAASLNMEYTLPGISQSVIITRMEGRTPVPERESIASLAKHKTTMVIFLSAGLLEELTRELMKGGLSEDTPAAIVYRASWPDELDLICTVGTLKETAEKNHVHKTALIIVGKAVKQAHYSRSRLYDPSFETGYRPASSHAGNDQL